MLGDALGMQRSTDPEIPIIELVSAAEARRQLGGISGQTLRRLVADGELRVVSMRKRKLFRRSDLNRIAGGE
jgi:excisionase family DNA binding protein